MRGDKALVYFVAWCVVAAVAYSSNGDHHCRCLDSDAACWPAKEEWDAFNASVGGRLIAPAPTGRACHEPHFDAASCQHIRENFFDPYLRADNAGSMQSENWEDDGQKTCSMDAPASAPCHQGQVPVVGVRVEETADVQKAIKFVSRHNLRLAVKSTGHDYLGRSTAAGSFLIWMHKLKNITVHESFVVCGRAATPAVTVGGGMTMGEVYDSLNSTGYIVVGGMPRTIAPAGGYSQGGGHSPLGPSFGLAVDNVLEVEVVTADGNFRVVNSCQEPDLFFALRGGGGGTFGVVTSVTYKLHKTPTALVGVMMVLQARNGTTWALKTQEDILTEWCRGAVALDSARWGGFWTFEQTQLAGVFLAPATEEAANATLTPIVQTVSQIENVTPIVFIFTTSSFQEWHRTLNTILQPETPTDYASARALLGSRITPLSAVKTNPRRVAQTILAAQLATGNRRVLAAMVIGPGVRGADPHRQTAVTPAWREGAWLLLASRTWSWNATKAEKMKARSDMKSFVKSLQASYPESGTYFNEASIDEPQWQRSFWGLANYGRLMATKLRVDPLGVFVCRRCVGSELWDDSGNCRRGL